MDSSSICQVGRSVKEMKQEKKKEGFMIVESHIACIVLETVMGFLGFSSRSILLLLNVAVTAYFFVIMKPGKEALYFASHVAPVFFGQVARWTLLLGLLGLFVQRQIVLFFKMRSLPVSLASPAELLKGAPWDYFEKLVGFGGSRLVIIMGQIFFITSDLPVLQTIFGSPYEFSKYDDAQGEFFPLLGKAIVTAEGESWKWQRTQMEPILHDAKLLQKCTALAVSECDLVAGTSEKVSNLDLATRTLALRVISKCLMSKPSSSGESFERIVDCANERIWRPWMKWIPSSRLWTFLSEQWKLNKTVGNLIETRSKGEDNILNQLCDLGFPADLVSDEVKTLLLAGSETSACMTQWTLYELFRPQNHEVLERVLKDVQDAEDHHWDPEFLASSKALAFTELCLKESLRVYSIVPVTVRIANRDVTVGSTTIASGVPIVCLMQTVHRDPKLWGSDANDWKPQRFEAKPNLLAFLPFTAGPRRCLGQFFSLAESKVVVCRIVQKFHLEIRSQPTRNRWNVPIAPDNLIVTATPR